MSLQTFKKVEFENRNGKIAFSIDEVEIVQGNAYSIPLEEQELVISDCRDDDFIQIYSSSSIWNTKIKKNKLFKLTRMVLSPEGRILEIVGTLPNNKLTLRGT